VFNFLEEVEHAFAVDLVVVHGVPRRTLFHKLGKDAGAVGCPPFRCHFSQQALAHGAVFPVGNDLTFVQLPVRGTNLEARFRPGVQDVQVLQAVAAEFRVGWCCLGSGTFLAHDKFAVADVNVFMFHQVGKCQAAFLSSRKHPLLLLVKICDQLCAFGGDTRQGIQALLPQAGNAF